MLKVLCKTGGKTIASPCGWCCVSACIAKQYSRNPGGAHPRADVVMAFASLFYGLLATGKAHRYVCV